jgi:hypothetical protein
MRLNRLQELIEKIYGIGVEHRVEDFLVTDAELARDLDRSETPRDIREKLLVEQTDEALNIALYLHESVVAALAASQSAGGLREDNMEEFLLALEGVSHFVYLAWNAARDRGVTLMELEMQAEIDKFVAITLMMGNRHQRFHPRELRKWLFDDPRFDENLDEEQRGRYSDANHFAGKYCFQLERKHWWQGRRPHRPHLFGELRNFYRLSQADKISLIHREYAPAV